MKSSASSVASSSSSSNDSQYFSANSSPTKKNTHDGFISSIEETRLKSSSSSSSSSSFSSSQSPSANPNPNTRDNTHDVFISFRGEDTRNNFVSHLLPALSERRDIRTYMDSDLERGDEISSAILGAIEQSKISLLVFSENYATSSWTLNELVKIMECKRTRGQLVLPIFYKVRPSDVRHQTGSYATAFKDKRWSKASMKKTVQQWKDALTEAASLVGWDSSTYRYL